MSNETVNMTGRERILRTFSHKRCDRIPVFDVVNNPDMYEDLLGESNYYLDGDKAVRLAKILGLDAVMVPVGSYTCLIKEEREWTKEDRFNDRFGVGYLVTDSSWPLGFAVDEVALDESFIQQIRDHAEVLEADLRPIRDAVREAHTGDHTEVAVFGGLRSAFSFLTISGGLVDASMKIYEAPDLLHELIEIATDYWTEVGLKLIEAGVDALFVANDMGMNGSTMISPDHLREFFLPAFARQCRTWQEAGGKVILHSCGNINAILSDLAADGCLDGLNNLQSQAGMDIAQVKKDYGDQWTLIGNVDATNVMTTDDTAEIDAAITELIASAAGDGGLIIATDHSFHKGIPKGNIYHFIEEAKRQGTAYCAERLED